MELSKDELPALDGQALEADLAHISSILLARESTLAVKAVNEEMDHRHLSS